MRSASPPRCSLLHHENQRHHGAECYCEQPEAIDIGKCFRLPLQKAHKQSVWSAAIRASGQTGNMPEALQGPIKLRIQGRGVFDKSGLMELSAPAEDGSH